MLAEERTKIDPQGLAEFGHAEKRIENFRHTERIFPRRRIRAPSNKSAWEVEIRALNRDYKWKRKRRKLRAFLKRSTTTSLLVVKDDVMVSENYFHGYTQESLCTSMSVAKSFISALVGIAVADGSIESIDDAVTDYVQVLKGSGYEGVPIKHVLQMSSGIDFSEEYDDSKSDINLLMSKLAGGGSLNEYVTNLKSKNRSGQKYYYASVDTQVLAMLLEQVSGQSIAMGIQI